MMDFNSSSSISGQITALVDAGMQRVRSTEVQREYLGASRLGASIFTAINADTMEIYTELVPFDAALAQRMSDRALKVISATDAGELLPRSFLESTHFECRMCAWQDRCWRNTP